jgi:hypothetical protein
MTCMNRDSPVSSTCGEDVMPSEVSFGSIRRALKSAELASVTFSLKSPWRVVAGRLPAELSSRGYHECGCVGLLHLNQACARSLYLHTMLGSIRRQDIYIYDSFAKNASIPLHGNLPVLAVSPDTCLKAYRLCWLDIGHVASGRDELRLRNPDRYCIPRSFNGVWRMPVEHGNAAFDRVLLGHRLGVVVRRLPAGK